MKKRLGLATCLAILFLGLFGVAHAQEKPVKGYIIDKRGKKHEGYLSATGSGGIQYRKSDRIKMARTFSRDNLRRIVTSKPKEVRSLEQALAKRKYDDVINQSGAAVNKYGWLGWGGLIYYLKGRALLAKKDANGAKAAFNAGRRYAGAEGRSDMLKRSLLEVRISQGDAGAMREVKRMKPSTFKYKMLGISTEVVGRQKNDKNMLSEAALQYLKVVLVYSKADLEGDLASQRDRHESYQRLVGVLTELKDNRAEDFSSLMKQEYGR
jgi:hypothetical protein